MKGQVDLGQIYSHDDDLAAYGYAEINSIANRPAQMVVGSDDTLKVWLNGKQVYDYSDRRGFDHEQTRFDVSLVRGVNHVLVRCGNRGGPWQFSVAVTGSSEYAFLKGPSAPSFNPDLYRAEALKGQGKPDRGRALFTDLKGLACVKCHAVGKQGGAVGPELSSVGAKYPRDELIAAVLYPSAKISSGYEPSILALSDGRVVTGIIKTETPEYIEIQDADAKLARHSQDRHRRPQAQRCFDHAQRPGPGHLAERFRRSDRVSGEAQGCACGRVALRRGFRLGRVCARASPKEPPLRMWDSRCGW